MGTSNGTWRSVADALGEVSSWRSESEAGHRKKIDEAEQEIESLKAAVANLQQQLEALDKYRDGLVADTDQFAADEVAKSYEAIFSTLAEQSKGAVARAAQVAESERARADALSEALGSSEVAPLLAEYEQFKSTVEPTLAALPDSYRSVILEHHQKIEVRLREHLASVASGPVEVDAEPLDLDVVVAVDAPEGAAELLMMVLPVDEAVHANWVEREDDLQTRLAARAVQGLYTACHAMGMDGVQAMFGGHQGLLAVELEVPEVDADELQAKLDQALGDCLSQAPELVEAKVGAKACYVSVDHLLPPEDDDEMDEEVSDA